MAALIIFTLVLLPLMTQIGVSPVHFGLIFCILIIIGLATPPVGMVLFVTSNVTGIRLAQLCREIVPFVITALVITLALFYLPDVVMFLPNLLGA